MGVESSTSSKILLRHVISILTITSLEDWVPSVSLPSGFCETGECGDVLIGYPFWNNTKPCCRHKLLLQLEPSWEDIVDYGDQYLRLISGFERTGDACLAPAKPSPIPPSATDTDVPSIQFPTFLKSNQKPLYLAFLRDCSGFPIADYPNPHSTCPSVGANHSYVALTGRPEDLHLNQSACESPLTLPVKLARTDGENVGNVDYEEKWNYGFRLKWKLISWENCVKSQKAGCKCRGRNGSFLCRGNTFRSIPCNSDSLISTMRFSVNFLAMLSKLDKDFKGRGRTFWLP